MTYDGVVTSGTPSYSSGNAKFGSFGVSGAVFSVNTVDAFISSAPTFAGGAYTTGTVEAWVKSASTGAVRVLVGHDGWYWMGVDASGNATARFGNSLASPSQEVSITSTTAITNGAWHHMALVFNNTSVSLYVDGTRVATSTAVPTLSADGGTRIGSLVGNTTYAWTTASIDEVRFSYSARYTGATYTVPTAAFVKDADTSAIYHFEGDATGDGNPPQNIVPNDANIVYSPYTWDVNGTRAKTINSGAYFRTLINGAPTSLTLFFDVSASAAPLPQITVSVDGRYTTTAQVSSQVVISLPTGTTWDKRHLQVTVKSTTETQPRWDSQVTAVVFQGITTSPRSAATEALTAKKLNVLVYGDSITEGVRTLNMTATNDTDRNDSTLGWAYHLGEKLGAEVGVVGFGATGISKASGSGGVPSFRNSLGLLWGSGPARNFTAPVPDAIVINEGTNDGSTDTTADMISALNTLLAATPSTTKIIVLRPFNGNTQAAYLQAAVSGCSAPSRVSYVDTIGWWNSADSSDGLHPYGYTNIARLSGLVANSVRAALNRGALYLNVGGTAKQISPTRY
jgi:lysophospholipase L1-like esterase